MRLTWRTNLLNYVIQNGCTFSTEEIQKRDIYQFGVFNGDSMEEIKSILSNNEVKYNKFFGFDVFDGMPKEQQEPIFQDSWDPDKEPDAFNVLKIFNLSNTKQVAEKIEKKLRDYTEDQKYKIFDGLVENTLKMAHEQNYLSPALYVDIDLDIYSPTKYVLDYMFLNKLITVGTLIGYDDWGGTPNYENYEFGESRAHKEICDKYNIKMRKLAELGNSFPHVHNIWKVEKIGF